MNAYPIILIGSQRSGTTWLGEVLATHPSIAYWSEPRHVWTRGFARRPDDVLTEADATPAVAANIRRTFELYVRRAGRDRLAEKTPSNCLRVSFVHAVFPEARLLLMLRDGRSVLESTDRIMRSGVSLARVVKRARETPVTEWPAYAGQAVETIARRAARRPLRYWGMKPPGWSDWVGRDAVHVMLAKQWTAAIDRATRDASALPEGACLTFRYEDLVQSPAPAAAKIAEFCSLRDPELFIDEVFRTVQGSAVNRWRDTLDASILADIKPIMAPTLQRIGYEW